MMVILKLNNSICGVRAAGKEQPAVAKTLRIEEKRVSAKPLKSGRSVMIACDGAVFLLYEM